METDFFEIQEFSDCSLIVEISVIERQYSVCHRILEISQIKFYDPVDEDMGIRESSKIIFPKRSLLSPIVEGEMKFLDRLLMSSKHILFFEFLDQ
jgi:hypothetical protein